MIRLQFVLGADPASRVIAWFSAGHFSHVDAILDGELLGARSDQAGGAAPGVALRSFGYSRFARRVVFELDASSTQERRWREFLCAQLGKPYDMAAIWGFAFNRDWRRPDAWTCSELQAAALEYAGIICPLYLPANKVTPVALAQIVSAVGGRVIEYEKGARDGAPFDPTAGVPATRLRISPSPAAWRP